MNLGRELVASALREGTLKPFTDAGISIEWLSSQEDLTRHAVFTGPDLDAYVTLVKHWDRHGKLPSLDMFRLSHPEASYRLPDSSYTPAELVEVFHDDRERYLAQLAASDIADAVQAGDTEGATRLMERAARMIRQTRRAHGLSVVWDGKGYDLTSRLARETVPGVPVGVKELDDQFPGWQKGNLVTFLGRAKAGKTSFAILSALHAFLAGWRVMIVTVEIDAWGVTDRLDAFGAQISLSKYAAGELGDWANKPEADRLRAWREKHVDGYDGGYMTVVQPTSTYTLTDLEYDIDQYQPDVVYVDGFYFMVDRLTGKNGGSWEGHDNLAREMKELAMRRKIPVIVTHQVREKQLTGKKGAGIDDGAMMGGTGLIMASDMVLGIDADDSKPNRIHTISCTRSRTGYLPTVKGTWDWGKSTFTVGNFDDEGSQHPGTDPGKWKDDNDAPF